MVSELVGTLGGDNLAPEYIYTDHDLSGTNRARPGLDQVLGAFVYVRALPSRRDQTRSTSASAATPTRAPAATSDG